MSALPFPDAAFDAVVMNQVLHYADAPAEAVREAARVVAPGGRLLVADYLVHGHDELRRDFAHAWAGFEADAVTGWMEAAGLRAAERCRHDGALLTSVIWEGVRC
jgi:ArsR family transcriptional regulator